VSARQLQGIRADPVAHLYRQQHWRNYMSERGGNPETDRTWCRKGTVMTIIDFKEQREARRRAEWDRWLASQERELAKVHRMLAELAPIFDQLLAQKKVRVRRPRCEAPGCWNTITTLQPVQARNSDNAAAPIALCAGHLRAVHSGRIRVNADEDDTLLWQLCDRPGAPPRLQIRLPRRKASRADTRPRASSV
jgi:hypothetical protein